MVASLAALHDELESTIVVPQTVVVETYWREVVAGLRAHELPLSAFTLPPTARHTNTGSALTAVEVEAAGWRRLRRADYDAALGWLSAGTTIIDTRRLTPAGVVANVRESVGEGSRC